MALAAHHLIVVRRRQQQKVRRAPHLDAVALAKVERARTVVGDQVQATLQVFIAQHMADVQPCLEDAQDVAIAQRVPGVDDRILAEAHVHACPVDLGHTRQPAAFGVAVEAPLQVDALGWARNEIDARHFQQAEQFGAVGIVIGTHGRGVACGHPCPHPTHPRFFGQHLEEARLRVVGLVAMHVHQAARTLGQLHEEFH
ncbi:hypothetical protein D3C81_1637360 [compost metagenome]